VVASSLLARRLMINIIGFVGFSLAPPSLCYDGGNNKVERECVEAAVPIDRSGILNMENKIIDDSFFLSF
jgi:hypothetical protein